MESETLDNLVPPDRLIDEVHVGSGNFQEIGETIALYPLQQGWITGNGTCLDIGCGLGRVARPLTKLLQPHGRYQGFDVNKRSIDWCNERYRDFRNFKFTWIDLKSIFYNPSGKNEARHYRFPLPDSSVDYANLSSVLTHMIPHDAKSYLHEVSRMLRSGKRCLVTYFLVDPDSAPAIADEASKGEWHAITNGYVRNREIPEEITLLDESFVREAYSSADLEIESFTYGNWRPRSGPTRWYQDTVVAVKR